MGKVILYIASSLDGFIARNDGNIDWLFTDVDYGYKKFYDDMDVLLMGKKTYDQVFSFGDWPYGSKKCYVISHKEINDSNIEVSKDPVGLVKRLKGEGKVWIVGGASIISQLLNAKMIDEIVISIHPILLGKGIPLFCGIEKEKTLELLNSESFESGLLQVTYKVR